MCIGVDIADISRFENISQDFLDKCFTDDEKKLFAGRNASQRIASNFASKEALSKALGTGIRGFSLKDISVLRDTLGKPYFVFCDNVLKILSEMGVSDAELTISHDGGNVVAVVFLNQCEKIKNANKYISKTDFESDEIISYSCVKSAIKPRESETHKGDYGKIFIVAGSKGLTGAGIMASKSALRSGGGLITLGCCESLNSIFETALHEVMTLPLSDNGASLTKICADEIIRKANESSVIAFGCGLSNTQDIYNILKRIIREVNVPIVIDADGINALSRNINILKSAKAPVILTPHIAEFSRISGLGIDEINSNIKNIASEFSVKYNVTLVLKGHNTIVATSDGKVKTNILGNPGMATGGSGDVLTGLIASFIGQGISGAALCAVYVHSLAGDIAAGEKGEYGMTPTDIIENIPYAIKSICKR